MPGCSTGMVFMFVLFGSLLETAGAGNYFIRTAFAGLGHMRGGPAKAAVVSSAMTGLVSGSSIANVVTTGTFTIPLMKKVGFSAEKAGAVEVASSTNGQLTPPVMGAAAFLMVEYVGISYIEVIKHAFLPAIISYIALVYIVHLEACKMGLEGMPRRQTKTLAQSLLSFVGTIVFLMVIGAATYYGLGWIKTVAGEATIYIVCVLLFVAYLALLMLACRVPELELTTEITELPPLGPTAQAGYYFLLPIVVLMWCLTVERLSPSFSAFWATVLMIFIVLTQRPLKGYDAKDGGRRLIFQARLAGSDQRHGLRRQEHDWYRRGHRGGGYRRRDRDPDRHRAGDDRIRRVHLRRQPDSDSAVHRRHQPAAGHGAADHRQLYRCLHPDGAGHCRAWVPRTA